MSFLKYFYQSFFCVQKMQCFKRKKQFTFQNFMLSYNGKMIFIIKFFLEEENEKIYQFSISAYVCINLCFCSWVYA